MKSKLATISIVWTVSLAVAYIVGAKISTPEKGSTDTANTESSSRPSYRAKINSSSTNSESRSETGRSSSRNSSSSPDISEIIKQNDPIERVNKLLAFINQLGPNDFPQVIADFRASGLTRERMSEYSMLLHAWAKEDPLSALDYAEQNTDNRFARQTILASWAADNPDGALQWAESNYEGNNGNPWLVGVIRGIAGANPQKASEIMNTMAFSRERGQALDTIVPHMVALGREDAISWLDTIEDERLLNGATARVAAQLTTKNPEATAEWATSLEQNDVRERAIGEVADNWADQDVTSAVAWTETLTGTDKIRAARELIGEFAREDSTQASEWLDSLAGNDGYERVAQNFIFSTAGSNPELALSKIPTIESTRAQDRYYERILTNWHRNDAEATVAWMQANNISEAIQQRATRTRNNR